MFVERRQAPRRNAFRLGSLFFHEEPHCLHCLIWNVSDFGALIEVEPHASPPRRFRVIATALNLDRNAMQTWRDGRKIGVAFVA
ncbi:pilus assembly protein PilZ [Methylobacterium durans]|uniref:Pilus assembly protein PilZ n=1 Tax=Methylobacterium durans TaxID=2202825 RepID=A0A2U8WAS6_9HYPH|nr:pilus assembly protein PilZ [Methylobacterium durans]AWN43129.1 pilus assembly protein PilZ [Methylobacterium durans]